MKKKIGVLFLSALCCFPPAAVGQSPEPAAAVGQTSNRQRSVKQLPTCQDFSDVYGKTVLKTAPATQEDELEMQSLASIMTGYVSALQDIFGARLLGMTNDDNEWTLLEMVEKLCSQYPTMTFQGAVRLIEPVSATVQALQDEEFNRCNNYIEQSKKAICSLSGKR